MTKGLKRISESHVKLTLGQGADIIFNQGQNKPGVEEIIQIFRLKTGEAIKVALMLGAILGEANDAELQILNDFSDLFGISYQIRDDLNEFRAEENDEDISDFPFLIALLNEALVGHHFNELSEFRTKVLELGLDLKANDFLNNYVQLCYDKLDTLSNSKLRLSLYGVLGKIFKTTNFEA